MDTATVASFRAFLERGFQLFQKLDGSFLQLVHPDYTLYHAPTLPLLHLHQMREKLFERYAVLAALAYDPEFLDVFVVDSVGVAVFELDTSSRFRDGTQTEARYRVTLIAVLEDGAWKIRHDHSTPIAGRQPAWTGSVTKKKIDLL